MRGLANARHHGRLLTLDPKPPIRNPGPAEPEFRNPNPETRNPKIKTRNNEPGGTWRRWSWSVRAALAASARSRTPDTCQGVRVSGCQGVRVSGFMVCTCSVSLQHPCGRPTLPPPTLALHEALRACARVRCDGGAMRCIAHVRCDGGAYRRRIAPPFAAICTAVGAAICTAVGDMRRYAEAVFHPLS